MILITVSALNLHAALRRIDYNHLFVFAALLKDQQHPHLKKNKERSTDCVPFLPVVVLNMFSFHYKCIVDL